MKAFVWGHEFVTGLPEVDEQHHGLVDLFNELSDSWFHGDSNAEAALQALFDKIVAYARFHFREEEALMHAEGVDLRHVQHHALLHEKFVAEVASMWQTRSTMRDPSELLIGFLTSWLGMHILGVDQSMARQIEHIRQGRSPGEAYDLEATAERDQSVDALLKVVGTLYHVLSERNVELSAANASLEARVQERTRELDDANQSLTLANGALEKLSRTDALMGIANRAYFNYRLDVEVARAFRSRQAIGLLMIDVDFFKKYNDQYGHPAGDGCLQGVARAITAAMNRTTDFVARYGGEEIVVILPDTDAKGVEQVAQRVCQSVEAIKIKAADEAGRSFVTVSVGGVASVPATKSAGVELLDRADRALYQAKASGRNRVCMSADGTIDPA